MTFYNRGGFDNNRGQNFNSRGGSNSGYDKPQMHDAVCAKCGTNCQVPFKPNGRKEVFCSKCFEDVNGGSSRDFRSNESRDARDYGIRDSRDSRDSRGSRSFSDRPMFNAVCDECGDNCKLPFEPRNGKPVLCSNCFANKEGKGQRTSPSSASNVDLSELNAKLDKIIKLLTPEAPKNLTEKIIDEIEANLGKPVAPTKKKAKTTKKKAVVKE